MLINFFAPTIYFGNKNRGVLLPKYYKIFIFMLNRVKNNKKGTTER